MTTTHPERVCHGHQRVVQPEVPSVQNASDHLAFIVQSLEEEHDGAGAVVGGDGGGPQLVDVATVVNMDGLGLIGVKSNNGLQEGNTDFEN